jgi:hypothetical protein
MRAGAIGTVVQGNSQLKEGDIVLGTLGQSGILVVYSVHGLIDS